MPQLRGERSRRVAVCTLLVGVLLSVSPPAHAAVPVGWAWEVQQSAAPSLGPVSGIPSGDVAVAWLGQADKIAYLGIGGAGSQSFAGAVLRLHVDPDATNVMAEMAQMSACLILGDWVPAEPMAWDTKPPTACDAPVLGRYDAGSTTFSFDLTPIANGLASAAVHGLAIEPVEMPAGSFQVVFQPDIDLRLAARPSVSVPVSQPANTGPVEAPVESSTSTENIYSPPSPVSTRTSENTGQSALAVTNQRRDDERPVSLTGVYAMLIVLGGLVLGGRVLAQLLHSKREDER